MSDPVAFSKRSDEDVALFCRRFYEAGRLSGRLYRSPGPESDLLFVYSESGPRPVSSRESFLGVIPEIVHVTKPKLVDGTWMDVPSRLTKDDLAYLFYSEEKKLLPIIRATVHEPVVYQKASGTLQVTHQGYNPEPEVYYWQDPSSRPIEPAKGLARLSECLSGVPFTSPGHKANAIAYLVGSVFLDRRLESPLLSVTGNLQNIGKSSLAQAIGHVLTGALPAPIDSTKGEEFGKQISTRINEGNRFVFIDNIVRRDGRSFNSPQLAKLLTEGYSKRVRVLGQSRTVSQEGVLFCLTMNDGKLDTDLSTRSLSVQLHAEKSQPMTPFVRDYAIQYRREIYAELLGMALSVSSVMESDEHLHFRFRRWLGLVLPRVRPYFGELAIAPVDSLNEISQEIYAYGVDRLGTEFTAQEFVQAILNSGSNGDCRFPALQERLLACGSNVGRNISGGRILSTYVAQPSSPAHGCVIVLRQVRPSMRNQGAVYTFEGVSGIQSSEEA